jgi:exoribonuclease-2
MPIRGRNDNINIAKIARDTMIQEGFKPDIPESVDREVQHLDQQTIGRSASPRDLRDLAWSSIDNLTSRDLDQVEYAEKEHDDGIRVLIGIADVAAFVQKGSATDSYSLENTTSVYTGVKTFPMLPEELSTNKTSLLEGQDRLAIVIEILVGPNGSVETRDVFPALVHNHSKLSYETIGNWLDRDGEIPQGVAALAELEGQIKLQLEASKRLNEVRKQNGTLRLETNQASPVLDEQERIVDLAIDERNSARDIIESFMVTANSAMAEFLERKGITGLRRVVRTPENWPRIVELARELNETLPSDPDPRALSIFLEHQRKVDPDHFPDLSLAVVKLLGPGDYVVHVPGQQGEGHFGLAVHRYTHSTAPNRRYADLIIQRLLKACIAERSPDYSVEELSRIAEHCNERESAARKVERKMRKVAAALFMGDQVGERFEAIVTGVTAKGTFARIVKPPVDGKVVKGDEGLKVGQKVRVKLLSTDPENGFIDFAAL